MHAFIIAAGVSCDAGNRFELSLKQVSQKENVRAITTVLSAC